MKKSKKARSIVAAVLLALLVFLGWKWFPRTFFSDGSKIHVYQVYCYDREVTGKIPEEAIQELLAGLKAVPSFSGGAPYSRDDYPVSVYLSYGEKENALILVKFGQHADINLLDRKLPYRILPSEKTQAALEQLFRTYDILEGIK